MQKGEGLELEPLTLSNFPKNPTFLKKIKNPLVKAWTKVRTHPMSSGRSH